MTPTQVFHLPLASSPAWLEVPCTVPGQGLAQAQALARALPALAATEQWLGTELPCPEPVAALTGASQAGAASHLTLAFDPASVLAGGRLVLPWAALKPGRLVPAGLPVVWPSWHAQLGLQWLPAQRIVASGLVPGAVLLLPAAFAGRWRVQLRALGAGRPAGWRVAAEWRPHEAALGLPGGPVQVAGDVPTAAGWSVWLAAPLPVDLRAWFGGCAEAAVAPAGPAELRLGDRAVAWGRLLPCGAGWGLRIEQVESLELAAAWT